MQESQNCRRYRIEQPALELCFRTRCRSAGRAWSSLSLPPRPPSSSPSQPTPAHTNLTRLTFLPLTAQHSLQVLCTNGPHVLEPNRRRYGLCRSNILVLLDRDDDELEVGVGDGRVLGAGLGSEEVGRERGGGGGGGGEGEGGEAGGERGEIHLSGRVVAEEGAQAENG